MSITFLQLPKISFDNKLSPLLLLNVVLVLQTPVPILIVLPLTTDCLILPNIDESDYNYSKGVGVNVTGNMVDDSNDDDGINDCIVEDCDCQFEEVNDNDDDC